ncbi:MAG: TIGR01212 family radical SAM protein [Coprococcus sp.]|nr:TIGR01212 family radical SAM protein [Coprococcus sp.]
MNQSIHSNESRRRWGERPYHSLDYALKSAYGQKLYKIALNGGCTCPNRDGTIGKRGCIFCSEGGSGEFASSASLTIEQQLEQGKALIKNKYKGGGYIAYFQAFTNTYAPLAYLTDIFTRTIADPEVKVLSIATRPDCLGEDVLSLLSSLQRQKPVWVELGLQTIHPESATFIRRGYDLPVFERAVLELARRRIFVIVHVILFLPGESKDQMMDTLGFLNRLPIWGIKLQLLHVLQNTDLAEYYQAHPFKIPSMEEYFEVLGACIARLNPETVIHRLTGDGPKDLLIAPLWTGRKRMVLNRFHAYLKHHDIWQGKNFMKTD